MPYSLGFFIYISVSFFFTCVQETANRLRSPGLFSVFEPILIMLCSGWSEFFAWFPNFLYLIQPFGQRSKRTNYNWCNPACSSVFQLSGKVQLLVDFFGFLLFSQCGLPGRWNPRDNKFSFFVNQLCLAFWPGSCDSFVFQKSREFYAPHFLGQIQVCASTFW